MIGSSWPARHRPYPYGNGLRHQPMAVEVPARSLRLEQTP
jgi:hypothetical protein